MLNGFSIEGGPKFLTIVALSVSPFFKFKFKIEILLTPLVIFSGLNPQFEIKIVDINKDFNEKINIYVLSKFMPQISNKENLNSLTNL